MYQPLSIHYSALPPVVEVNTCVKGSHLPGYTQTALAGPRQAPNIKVQKSNHIEVMRG